MNRRRIATACIFLCLGVLPVAAEDPSETVLFAETAETATMTDGVLTLTGIDDTIPLR